MRNWIAKCPQFAHAIRDRVTADARKLDAGSPLVLAQKQTVARRSVHASYGSAKSIAAREQCQGASGGRQGSWPAGMA